MGVHVRVVTPITTASFRKGDEFDGVLGADDLVSHVRIDRGPASIECEYDEMLAAPDTVARIIEAEREGADAVVIDCMSDPGVRPGRECVRIPVLGPCETSMHLACTLGDAYSVITIMKRSCAGVVNQARLFGAREKLASVRAVDIPVLALETDPAATRKALADEALKAIDEDGADVIIFGCTGMQGCADAVRESLLSHGRDAPVIDPVPVTIRLAAALATSGLSHSKTAFQAPPEKPAAGCDMPPIARRDD